MEHISGLLQHVECARYWLGKQRAENSCNCRRKLLPHKPAVSLRFFLVLLSRNQNSAAKHGDVRIHGEEHGGAEDRNGGGKKVAQRVRIRKLNKKDAGRLHDCCMA